MPDGLVPELPNFAAEAERLVIDLNVPYPWLVLAILREFLSRFLVFDKIDSPNPLTFTRYGKVEWLWPGRAWPSSASAHPPTFEADPKISVGTDSIRRTLERRAL